MWQCSYWTVSFARVLMPLASFGPLWSATIWVRLICLSRWQLRTHLWASFPMLGIVGILFPFWEKYSSMNDSQITINWIGQMGDMIWVHWRCDFFVHVSGVHNIFFLDMLLSRRAILDCMRPVRSDWDNPHPRSMTSCKPVSITKDMFTLDGFSTRWRNTHRHQ